MQRRILSLARSRALAAQPARVAAAAMSAPARYMSGAKLWGGRFTGKTDPLMEAFNNSIGFDKRLWRADIVGSIAYAKALGRCGILKADEVTALVDGLNKVRPQTLPVVVFTC